MIAPGVGVLVVVGAGGESVASGVETFSDLVVMDSWDFVGLWSLVEGKTWDSVAIEV